MNTRPNVLYILTDDQRFDTINALGNSDILTPNLDKLVERGTAFTHACIPGGTSGAVCMPSRAMTLTGRTLFHIDGEGQRIPEDHITMGEAFKSAGYNTFGAGKWHNGCESYHRSFTHGDEIYFGGMADHWNVPAYHFDPTGKYDKQIRRCVDAHKTNELVYINADHINAGEHSSETIAQAGINFVKEHHATPFMMYLSFLAPHDPRTMPDEFREMYNPDDMELPPNFLGGHPFETGALNIRDEMLAGFPRRPDETQQHIAEYYAMITHLDFQIGRVMDELEFQGVLDNTIIVLAGDNGLAVGQHGLMGKQSLYDHSVRVPLLFSGPGVPMNKQRDALVHLSDIFPTLCELTGIDIPESVEGASLKRVMEDKTDTPRDEVYLAYCCFQRGLRDDRYKLIEYAYDHKHVMTQLFDLLEDPWEMNNLLDNPDYTDKLVDMRIRLRRLAEELDDTQEKHGAAFWPHVEAAFESA